MNNLNNSVTANKNNNLLMSGTIDFVYMIVDVGL